MTPDNIRVRLTAALARRQPKIEVECSMCHGTGTIQRREKMTTQAEVARAVGIGRSQIANFVTGRTDLSLPVGLKLIEWLDEHEERGND